jgi:hypothetical protein
MTNIAPMLSGAYQKPAKKPRQPKGGEKGNFDTQVGELDDEMKEPSPAMRIKRIAQDEKVHATRKWVAGELTDRQHAQAHRRANHAIKNAHKLGSRK